MGREWPTRSIDESVRRIRTGHHKQSQSIFPGHDDKRDGIQRHMWEKCRLSIEPNVKQNQIDNPEKSVPPTELVDQDKSKIQKRDMTTPRKNTKCESFPAMCTINLCPACRNLECNVKGKGRHMTMSYDDPDCELTTNRPSICATSASENRSSNKPLSESDINFTPHSSQRCIPTITSSPRPFGDLKSASRPSFPVCSIQKYCPTPSSSFLSKTNSIPSQSSSSPKKYGRFMNYSDILNDYPGTETGRQRPPMLSSSKNKAKHVSNSYMKRQYNRRNGSDSLRKPPLSSRMSSTSPRPIFERSQNSSSATHTPNPLASYRSRISAPTFFFDQKPPLPITAYNNQMACSSLSSGKVSDTGDARVDSCDDAGSQFSLGNMANNQYSNNSYCTPYNDGCSDNPNLPNINVEVRGSSDRPVSYEIRPIDRFDKECSRPSGTCHKEGSGPLKKTNLKESGRVFNDPVRPCSYNKSPKSYTMEDICKRNSICQEPMRSSYQGGSNAFYNKRPPPCNSMLPRMQCGSSILNVEPRSHLSEPWASSVNWVSVLQDTMYVAQLIICLLIVLLLLCVLQDIDPFVQITISLAITFLMYCMVTRPGLL